MTTTTPTAGPATATFRYTFTDGNGAKVVRSYPVRGEAHGEQLLADARALHGADCDAVIIPATPAPAMSLLGDILRETRGCTKVFAAIAA